MKHVRSKCLYLLLIFGIFAFVHMSAVARTDPNKGAKNSGGVRNVNTATYPSEVPLNINNLTSWIRGDGWHDPIVSSSWNGTFPKGTAGFIYAEGVVWGGKVNDGFSPSVRVAGNVYASSCRAGKILTDSLGNVLGREPDDAINNRVFRVRRDWATADLTDDAANYYLEASSAVTEAQRQNIRDQYRVDWNTWPVAKGAPYEDRNHNGIFDPDPDGRLQNAAGDTLYDIPGFPGADQTDWLVYNDLDAGTAASDYGSPPIGLEVQETDWAYAATNPLGNMIFKKSRIIYKGTVNTPHSATIDSMFIVQWADPDNGQYSDDFAGCDTNLSLGYVYNSTTFDAIYFNQFGLPPPAGGFDFLQGPIIPGSPGDSAIFDLKVRYGYKNLPMTTFTYFAAGSSRNDPDRGGAYSGTLQWYNLMRGAEARPQYPALQPLYDQFGNVTHFELSGDPVTGTGDLDGKPTDANTNRLPPGDRRIVLSSGPFTMTRGDTQEIVTALVGGLGKNYLSSVSVLKFNTGFARFAYNNFFDLPSPPAQPKITVANLDRELMLNWGTDETSVDKTENTPQKGFVFEGYNIYQLPSANSQLSDGIRLATFDLKNLVSIIFDNVFDEASGFVITKPVQFGSNSGIQRFFKITKDASRGNAPLVDGQTYYFAVTAYSYNGNLPPTAPFHVLESSPVVIITSPHSTNPGVRYHAAAGDTLHTVHASGTSDGAVVPVVLDTTKLTGDLYKVTFSTDTTTGGVVWALTDSTKDSVVLSNQTNQSGDENYISVGGVEVKVQGPPPGMKDYDIPSGERRWTPNNANFGLEGFSGAMGMAYINWFSSSSTTPDKLHNVLIKLAATDVNGNLLNPSDTTASFAYRYLRHASFPAAEPSFAPYIVNPGAGYAYQDYTRHLPFAAYDEETGHRLMVGFLENNATGGLVDGKYWPPDYSAAGADNVGTQREWFFIFDETYSETPDVALEADILDDVLPIMWMGTPCRRGDVAFSAGDEFEILANHINGPLDVFTYMSVAPTSSTAVAKTDVEQINVFPNPYYGFNARELTRLGKYVTFNHLPSAAVIRIFNLAGVLVKTIQHTNGTQFDTWNLRNESQLPVASGIYIVYIDMPGLQTTKVLKLALIQEEQILRVY